MTYPRNEPGVETVARGRDYDPETIRKDVQLCRKDPSKRVEEKHLLETYPAALGMSDEQERNRT